MPSARDGPRPGRRGRGNRPAGTAGAWLPWTTVEKVCQLKLRPESLWPVFLAVLLTSSRYGGRPAHLSIAELAGMTGLSPRTVKRALARLITDGLLVLQGRYGRLQVAMDAGEDNPGGATTLAPPAGKTVPARGASMVAPRRGHHAGPSPTCIYVSLLVVQRSLGTQRQRNEPINTAQLASRNLGKNRSCSMSCGPRTPSNFSVT